jgi:hypothetical protein
MMPTSSSTCGNGRKEARTGTIMVDVPNPVIVPTALAASVSAAIRATSMGWSKRKLWGMMLPVDQRGSL